MSKTQEKEILEEDKSSNTFKAAVMDKPRSITFIEQKLQEPSAGEILVKMEGVGLCASGIPLWEGREWFSYPLDPGAPGHEGWGRIVKVGEGVNNLEEGRRVALLSGNVFKEYVIAPAGEAIVLPEALEGKPFPGEPFGCLMNIMDRAEISAGQTVAIIGLGFLGQGLVRLAKQAGAKVVALSRRDASLEMASEADLCVKMDDHYRIIEQLNEYTGGKGFERVIECTGKQWPLDLGTALIGEYGKFVIAGYHQDGLRNINMQQWNWKAIDVINAHERNPERYREGVRRAIAAVEEGKLDPETLLTHRFSFSQLQEASEMVAQCPDGFIKAYVTF
jgi:2-desacetyl-2-hydroxyethyl bacteriochlorophyllide A dehydrogenase